MGLGTLLMSMAHFAAPPYQPEKGISLTCDTSSSKFSLLLLYIHFFYVCIHVYMVAYMYIWLHIYIWLHTCIYVCIHVYMVAYIYIWLHTSTTWRDVIRLKAWRTTVLTASWQLLEIHIKGTSVRAWKLNLYCCISIGNETCCLKRHKNYKR